MIFSESQVTLFITQYLDLGTIGSSASPLIVHGVLNLVKDYEAALSMKKVTSLWLWRKVAGILLDTSPSRVLLTIYAFDYDHAITIIFFAFFIVYIPIEIAHFGTCSKPPKSLAASILVILLK